MSKTGHTADGGPAFPSAPRMMRMESDGVTITPISFEGMEAAAQLIDDEVARGVWDLTPDAIRAAILSEDR